jgi:hypothetical protein
MDEADDQWLKDHVGRFLADALSAVSIQQPADPIEFVGLYLLNAVKAQQRREHVCFSFFIAFVFFHSFFISPLLVVVQVKALEEAASQRRAQFEETVHERKDATLRHVEQRQQREQSRQQAILEERIALFVAFTEVETEKDKRLFFYLPLSSQHSLFGHVASRNRRTN